MVRTGLIELRKQRIFFLNYFNSYHCCEVVNVLTKYLVTPNTCHLFRKYYGPFLTLLFKLKFFYIHCGPTTTKRNSYWSNLTIPLFLESESCISQVEFESRFCYTGLESEADKIGTLRVRGRVPIPARYANIS